MDKKISVLYVDDEPINLKIFELSFKNKYIIYTTSSGLDALEILRKNIDIRVVIADMRMPKINGLEFISMAHKEFENIKYFILTGYDITDEIAEALNNKTINKYFRKPFNFREIESAVDEVIA